MANLTEKIKKYNYLFGIDKVNIGNSIRPENSCFVSNEIEIGFLNEEDYIQLSAKYDIGLNGSIEFYIIDGSNIKPILPIEENQVIDEKIFTGFKTRFSIDSTKNIIIKENGIISSLSLEEVYNSEKTNLTITYTPINSYSVKTENHSIKIKAILRLYDNNTAAPYIKEIAIKKFGGSTLWEMK